MNRWIISIVLLSLFMVSGCGGASSQPLALFNSRVAPRSIILGKIAAHRSAIIADSPYVVNYSPTHRLIATLSLIPNVTGSSYLINGQYVGRQSLAVPLGWRITLQAINGSTRPLRCALISKMRAIKKMGPIKSHGTHSVSWTTPHHSASYTFIWFTTSTTNPIAGLPVEVQKRSRGAFIN